MSEELLSWTEWQSQVTQRHQVNDCKAVDVGFGNLLVSAMAGGEAPEHKRYDAVRGFYRRQPNSWVKMTDQDDPKLFLRDLMASAAVTKKLDGKAINPIEMPIVFFTRQPGSMVSDGEIYAPRKSLALLGDTDTQKPMGRVNLHHESLTYIIGVCAWDVPTLDFMTRQLAARFRHHIRGFSFECELAGVKFPADADVLTKTVSWDPASPPADTDRLLCLTTAIEVIAEAHELEGLESKEVGYRLMEPYPLFEVLP